MSATSKRRVVESDWRHVELPLVNGTLCTGCGLCVDVCPTQCVAMVQHLPALVRPLDCVSCGLCAAVCPADALEMKITS